jgi:chemotaxis protein CheX
MKDFDDSVCHITQNVWESILGQEIHPSTAAELLGELTGKRTLTGCVQLAGAWEGTVLLHCSLNLATRLAAVMFSMEAGSLGQGEIEDAWGELANMVAGNVKALLPRPCQLSLPAVVQGLDYHVVVPGTRVFAQSFLECQGEPVLVTLLEGGSGRTAIRPGVEA